MEVPQAMSFIRSPGTWPGQMSVVKALIPISANALLKLNDAHAARDLEKR